MWMAGQSASQIARKLGGVSRNAVIGKVHRMGMAGRDRPTAPRAVGIPKRRQLVTGQSNSMVRRRPVRAPGAPMAPRIPGQELAATATILTLTQDDCRWPIGDPQEAGFGYCGRLRGDHASYCEHHGGVARQQRTPRRAGGLVCVADPAPAGAALNAPSL